MSRIDIFRDRLYWKYGISFIAHEVTIKFLTGNKENTLRLYNKLRRMCEVVSSHFSRDYVLSKTVSRSRYSKIRIGISASKDETKYSIKSILKNKLLENFQTLVLIL